MAFDVRRLDIYRKIPKDLTQPTVTGAIISICCCGFMGVLFFSEFFHFITTSVGRSWKTWMEVVRNDMKRMDLVSTEKWRKGIWGKPANPDKPGKWP